MLFSGTSPEVLTPTENFDFYTYNTGIKLNRSSYASEIRNNMFAFETENDLNTDYTLPTENSLLYVSPGSSNNRSPIADSYFLPLILMLLSFFMWRFHVIRMQKKTMMADSENHKN